MSPNDKELEHFESDPVIRSGEGAGDAFAKIVARRLSRRDLLKTGLAAAAGAVVLKPSLQATAMTETQGLNFTPLTPQTGDQVQVPEGYSHQVLLKWGDPIRGGAPEFDAHHQTSEAQDIQFGYNCDFVGFLPLPVGSKNSRHGLLCVNHEYINPELMFSNYDRNTPSAEQVDIMMSAVGFSVTAGDLLLIRHF
jgi:secreted PhoX family phosphatase